MTLVRAGDPADRHPLTDYERRVLRELDDWKHPAVTFRSRAADVIELGIDQIASRLPVGFLDQMIRRGLPALNRVASMTAVDEFVLAAYRRKGHVHVRSLDDIAALSLEDVERVVGTKRFAELIKGAGEGGLAGFYGAAGAVVDVPALLALALRSVNVFAYSYGFDPTTDEGRALRVPAHVKGAAPGGRAGRAVQRLMREHGIQGAKRRGKPWQTTKPDPDAQRRADLVERNFSAEAPNRLWLALASDPHTAEHLHRVAPRTLCGPRYRGPKR